MQSYGVVTSQPIASDFTIHKAHKIGSCKESLGHYERTETMILLQNVASRNETTV